MLLKRIILLITLVFIGWGYELFAQIEVKENSFKEVQGFVNIDRDRLNDDNNEPYAVVKIRTENINNKQRRDLRFGVEPNISIEVVYKTGEIWLYISHYARNITISSNDFNTVVFDFPMTLRGKGGYEMTLVNKAEAVASGFAYVAVNTTPESGADIYVDGIKMDSKSPYSLELPPGIYQIRVTKEFFKDVTKAINLKNGDDIALDIDMPLNYANITLTADNETDVYVDDNRIGKGTWTGRMKPGNYKVVYKKSGFFDASRTITVVAANDASYSLNLQQMFGSVKVATKPSDMDVKIDGKKVGKSPTKEKRLSVGWHRVEVSGANKETINESFYVNNDQTTDLFYKMKNPNRVVDRNIDNNSYLLGGNCFVIENMFDDMGAWYLGVSFGTRFGKSSIGWFFSGTFHPTIYANANYIDCDDNFLVNGFYPQYNGKYNVRGYNLLGGLVLRNNHSLCYRVGVGYGRRMVVYQLSKDITVGETSYEVVNDPNRYIKGIEFSLGILYFTGNWDTWHFTADITTIAFRTIGFKFGYGF